MKFKLVTSGKFYSEESAKDLETLGFKFNRSTMSEKAFGGPFYKDRETKPEVNYL